MPGPLFPGPCPRPSPLAPGVTGAARIIVPLLRCTERQGHFLDHWPHHPWCHDRQCVRVHLRLFCNEPDDGHTGVRVWRVWGHRCGGAAVRPHGCMWGPGHGCVATRGKGRCRADGERRCRYVAILAAGHGPPSFDLKGSSWTRLLASATGDLPSWRLVVIYWPRPAKPVTLVVAWSMPVTTLPSLSCTTHPCVKPPPP